MFIEQQISILEWFLKDHVTLKSGVMMLDASITKKKWVGMRTSNFLAKRSDIFYLWSNFSFFLMCLLSPLLVIPMLQTLFKIKKAFSVRSTVSTLTSGRLLLLLTTICGSVVAKRSIPDLWIFILNSLWHESKPVKYDFQTHADKTKRSCWLTFAKHVHKTHLFESAQSPFKVHYCKI